MHGRLLWLVLAGPLAAQAEPAATPWFVYLRDGGSSPFYGFVSYSTGRAFVMTGVLMDPPNGYREYVAGPGVNLFSASGNGAAIAALASDATDAWYAVLYVLPQAARGPLRTTGFLGWYSPLEAAGVRQYFVDPVTLLYRAHPRLAIGGSYTLYKIEQLPARQGAGPSLQLVVPSGTIMVDALVPLAHFTRELRLTLQFVF